MGMRESEGCIRAMTPGNGYPPGPGRAKAARVGVIVRKGPMTGASTSANHVTATSNGSGPRATSHISGRAGWWKSPSPDLVRASGE